jgi:hypothetical protein
MVTGVPAAPKLGETPVMLGKTVNGTPLLANPLTVTTTAPLVTFGGTVTGIDVALQFVGVTATPLKVTVLVPCVEPKFTPVIVTGEPIGPDAGEMLLIVGVIETVNGNPLLDIPLTVTTTLPDVAVSGTGTEILVEVQLVGAAVVPLKVTVLAPCEDPKFAPPMVTDAPGTATFGEMLPINGIGICPLKVVLTLSKVAVSRVAGLPLVSTRPTSTFVVMAIVCVDPACVQFNPSGER